MFSMPIHFTKYKLRNKIALEQIKDYDIKH